MANDQHLAILLQGVDVWNAWRKENPDVVPDLSGADLIGTELRSIDFSRVNLFRADFSGANLREANLSEAALNQARFVETYLHRANFNKANLSETNFERANLSQANLSQAHLIWADIYEANFIQADLRGAALRGTELSRTDLSGTDLSGADLSGAVLNDVDFSGAKLNEAKLSGAKLSLVNFIQADLSGAKFNEAIFNRTLFSNNDLSTVIALDTVSHIAPSSIGIDTLIRSRGKIPEAFLRGCGVPDTFIEHIPWLIDAMQPSQFYSCFISHSSKDEAFAEQLHERMRAARLPVWFAPEDVKGGEKLHEQIEQAIEMHDRLLLILSEESIRSKWVERELRRARKAELRSGRRKLFPIRLADYAALRDWECIDSEGNDLAEEVRQYFIPDFTNWKDHDAFEAAFARLLRDLKLTEAPPVPASPKHEQQVVLTSEHFSQLQQRLETHRGTLASYLERRAILGKAHAPPEIAHGISDARKEIARIKAILREKGVAVEDHPDDESE
jgi:uncharacterized protein YjbI with pentapeptide repeats/ribosomal protein L29